ncbi:putative Ig domain-containing protein [Stieleria sp. ICT_E10.1]|uniref:putative Ig domain-containing protein n=1 Tax=Stieleria sedimenti TaxID=2976331 RepID=UPI00218085C9|nr:putative Ig domain-containing protein [Stieleria sedimenti]MCS7468222.1 putative Ig domain-containing protein [Stieleria sedimenti]
MKTPRRDKRAFFRRCRAAASPATRRSVHRRHSLRHELLERRDLLAADPANVIAHLSGHSDHASQIPFEVHTEDFVSVRGTQVLTFRVDSAAGSSLNPAAAVVHDASGTVYPLNYSQHDLPGSTSSVIVAELTPGQYTLDIAAEGDNSGAFDVSVGLAGDLDGDGQVQLNDRSAMIGLLRGRSYQVEADVNQDGRLTSFDTGHLLRNLGVVTSISPLTVTATLAPEPDASLADGTSLTRISAQTVVGQTNPSATAQMDVDGDQQFETDLTVDGVGAFSSNITLTEGLNSIGVIAMDRFGQQAETVITVMLDSTPPPLTLSLAAASDTDPVGDQMTSLDQVTVEGKTEPSLVVTLYRNGDLSSAVATVTADAAGAYQYASQAVALGTNLFTVVSSDAAGNTSQANLEVTRVTGDVTAPAIGLSLVVDSGSDSGDRITNESDIAATVTDVSTISLVRAALDGSEVGVLTEITHRLPIGGAIRIDADLLATLHGGPLADGTYQLRLEATDEFGNRAQSSLSFTLDTTAPVTSIATPENAAITDRSVSVSGQVTDATSGVALLQGQRDQGSLFQVGFDGTGSFLFETAPPADSSEDGEHTITMHAMDVAGNQSAPTSASYVLDTIAPTLAITAPAEGLITNINVNIEGKGSDERTGLAAVEAKLDAGMYFPVSIDASGNFAFPTDLLLDGSADGPHLVSVRAVDNAGNHSESATIAFVLDATPPEAALSLAEESDTDVLGDHITSLDLVTLLGQTEPGIRVLFPDDGRTAQADSSGRFSFANIPLVLGNNTIEFALTDAAGNQATAATQIIRVPEGITLVEGDRFTVVAEFPITVPEQPSHIEVSYANLLFDTADDFINDAFEIALVDRQGRSLVHAIAGSTDAAFNLTEGEPALLGANTLHTGETVKIDLAHLPAGTEGTLVARLVNNDGDTTTSVVIQSREIVAGSLGTPLGAAPVAAAVGAVDAPNFATLSDVTGSLTLEYGTTSFNEDASKLSTEVTIRNDGTYALDGPLVVVIDTVSDPSVRVRDFDGLTPEGRPYYDFSALLDDGTLQPGEQTSARQLAFFDPNETQFTFASTFYAQLNRAPVFTSTPDVEAIVGRPHRDEVMATDPDGDAIIYSLLIAPDGMTIDAQTGRIDWQTSAADLGNHAFTVQADDGRGGVAKTSYTLATIDPPPNRPPVFESTPSVIARVNQHYEYPPAVRDPDGDALIFTLLEGPVGLSVDSTTGLLSWIPSASQVTSNVAHRVVLQVSDGAGGVVTQRYEIDVSTEVGNSPPTFVSSPPSRANLPGDTSERVGDVNPNSIGIDLAAAQTHSQTVSLTLPDAGVTERFADVVFIVDESFNMRENTALGDIPKDSRHGWIADAALELESAFETQGVGPNRYGLFGFGQYDSASPVREFATSDHYSTAAKYYDSLQIRSADVDNDNDMDLIGDAGYDIVVYLNDGAGHFAPGVVYATGLNYFIGYEITDLNGDGNADIVATGGAVSVLLGLGDGRFSNYEVYRAPRPLSPNLTIGDVNGDQIPDLAVTPFFYGDVYLFLGDGNGGFLTPSEFEVGPYRSGLASPRGVDFGDVDGDGDLDLLSAANYDGTIVVLRGDGAGTFSDETSMPKASRGQGLGSGIFVDVNQDNVLDIAYGFGLSFLIGDGIGGFSLGTSYAVNDIYSAYPVAQQFGDLDGDGDIDVVIDSETGVSVFLNDGNGTFSERFDYLLTSQSLQAGTTILADTDGDGALDIVFTQRGQHMFILRGFGDGTFDGPVVRYGPIEGVKASAGGDLDGDGNSDIVAISTTWQGENLITIAFGNGQGSFDSHVELATSFASSSLAVGDVDNDGDADVIVDNGANLAVFLNDGTGGIVFDDSYAVSTGDRIGSIVLEDLTRDGLVDVIATNAGQFFETFMLSGLGGGRFSSSVDIGLRGNGEVAIEDFNGDGVVDLVSAAGRFTGIQTLLGKQEGGFNVAPTPYSSSNATDLVVTGDVDGDGDIDIVTANFQRTVTVFVNDGTGDFSISKNFAVSNTRFITALAIGDLNGDSFSDVVVSDRGGSFDGDSVAVLFGNAIANLEKRGDYETVREPRSVTLVDLNGDETLDFVASNSYASSIVGLHGLTIALNDGYGDFSRFGTAEQVARASQSLISYGGKPDGYLGIHNALDYVLRSDADVYFVLVTSNDRYNADPSLGFGAIYDELHARGVLLNVIVDGEFADGLLSSAIGVDSTGNAFVENASGEIVQQPGGQFTSGSGKDHYVDLAWSLGGSAWDLDLLRRDPAAAQAFVQQSTTELFGEDIRVIASDANVQFVNQSGTRTGVLPGQSAAFDIQFTGDGNAHGFDLLFVTEDGGNVLGSIPVVINAEYVYQAQAIDPDAELLTYALSLAPDGATIDPNSGLVRWRPTVSGDYTFRISAHDTRGGVGFQEFNVHVTSGEDNTAPQLDTPAPPVATVGNAYELQLSATDLDEDRLSYFLTQSPDGMGIDTSTGRIRWSANASQVGRQDVTAIAIDGRGGTAEVTFTVIVAAAPVNNSPRIESTPASTASLDEPYLYYARASDPNGDPISWELASGPEGMVIDSSSGILIWQPTAYQSDPVDVLVKVRDNRGGLDLQRFQVELERPNTRPEILVTPATRAVVGLPHQYVVRAQDGENDPLTFSTVSPPAGLSIDTESGLISWTPSAAQIGSHAVTVTVSDGHGHVAVRDIDFVVVPDAPNSPPQFAPVNQLSPRVGTAFRFQLQAIDPDGDSLTYQLLSGPSGLVVAANGTIDWTPSAEQALEQRVEVRVEDGRGGSDAIELTLLPKPALFNHMPELLSTPPETAVSNRIYAYDLIGYDADGDLLTWSLERAPVGMSLDPIRGTLRWVPQEDQVGEHVVTIGVYDGQARFGRSLDTYQITVRPLNTPPQFATDALTQGAAGQLYEYRSSATDIDNDRLTYHLISGPSGMLMDSSTGRIDWVPDPNQIGTHAVAIRVVDGFGGTGDQAFEIVGGGDPINAYPSIRSEPPFSATVDEAYEYLLEANDPENETLQYSVIEAPDGLTIDANTGQVSWQPTAIQIGSQLITLAATDIKGASAVQRFSVVVFSENHAPTIRSTPFDVVTAGNHYGYSVNANDADDDSLLFSLLRSPSGMTIDSRLGRVQWSPIVDDIGGHPIEIQVSDRRGGMVTQVFTLDVIADAVAPQVAIQVSENPATVNSDVFVQVTASDAAVESLTLHFNGVPVALDGSGRGRFSSQQAGTFVLEATAVDQAGLEGKQTVQIEVLESATAGAPIVSISSPTFGHQVTGPVDVIGTVTDDTLVSYTLSYAPLGGGEFIEIASGTDPVTDGVLGRFDPTLLGNDTYILQLFAQDASGKTSTEQILVDVIGELKIGNFALSFTDLSIPVAGIPITVARTYESLNASSASDFGFGWRLEFADADIRTSVAKTQAEEDLIYNPFYDGARVYVTLPGGKREGFTFRLNLAPGVAGAYLGIYEGKFVADSGVTSTLSAETYQLRTNESGEALEYLSAFPWNPLSPTFGGGLTLTTVDGTRFSLDGTTGDVREIADRNDNTLTFREDGIVSSDGQEVRFERDPQGRIVAVVDPLGKRIGYSYDANGNLAAVTDREGNTTRYLYDEPTRPLYLTEVIDPLDRTGIRSEYDSDGRLIKMVDADGKEISLTHDPANQLETVTNQLGFPTVFEYDDLGNVIREVDAEGGVTLSQYGDSRNPTLETAITRVLADGTELTTTYAYDARGNVTSETDPAGNVTWSTYDPFGNVLTSTDPLGNTSTHRYDARGNLLSIVDADGSATTFSYDSSGNPLSVAVGSNVTAFQYDGRGRVTRQTDAVGTVRTYTYDAIGNQLTETVSYSTAQGPSTVVTESTYDADGRVVARVTRQDGVTLATSGTKYDPAGNRVEEIDALGRRTKFVYDDRGLMTETIYPDDTPADDTDNPRTRTEYDAAGQVIAEIDELGRTTRFIYDRVGRRTATIHPDETPGDDTDNPRTETQYDAIGRVLAEIDERGNRVEFRYDAVGNRTETILPDATPGDLNDNPRLQDQYDASGRRTSSTDPLGNTTRFVYTGGGLPLETILPDATPLDLSDNPRLRSEFDDQRRLIARIDAAGRSTGYEYDDLGRLAAVLQTVDSRVLRTEYEYNELGGLIVQRDAEGRETRFEYDALGRRTATVLPLGQRNSTQYDSVGRAESTTDFNGDTIAYQYDARDRLTSKLFPDTTTVEFGYMSNGLRESVVDARGTTTFQYDARDRLLSRTDPDGRTISYTYDVAGNRTSLTIPSGVTTYTFDELNRQSTVTDPESGVTSYAYDATGRLVLTTLPNGTSEIREYDVQNRLLFLENRSATDVISSYRYTLDATGNRTAVDEHDGRRVEYEYDEIYRLVEERFFDPGDNVVDRTISYLYDDVGNRQSRADSSEETTTYSYDDNDRLLDETLDGIVTAYTYDDNGNTLSKQSPTDTVFYHWDFENRLVGVDTDGDGSIDVTNQYDADGIRVSQTVSGEETRFLIDANRPYQQVLEEYTLGGIIKVTYVHGHDLISQNRHGDTGKSFYHVDGLGSTRALSDALGIVTDRYIYDAFGRMTGQVGSTSNLHLFAGEQRDPHLSLHYLRARWIDVVNGRFESADPFPPFLRQPLTINRFAYTVNNPINLTDPTGLFSISEVSVAQDVRAILGSIARTGVSKRLTSPMNLVDFASGVVDVVFIASAFITAQSAGFTPGFNLTLHRGGRFARVTDITVAVDLKGILKTTIKVQDKAGKKTSFSIGYDFEKSQLSGVSAGRSFELWSLPGPTKHIKLAKLLVGAKGVAPFSPVSKARDVAQVYIEFSFLNTFKLNRAIFPNF